MHSCTTYQAAVLFLLLLIEKRIIIIRIIVSYMMSLYAYLCFKSKSFTHRNLYYNESFEGTRDDEQDIICPIAAACKRIQLFYPIG